MLLRSGRKSDQLLPARLRAAPVRSSVMRSEASWVLAVKSYRDMVVILRDVGLASV